MWHVGGTVEFHIQFWWGTPKERDNLEDLAVEEKIILKLIFNIWGGETCTRFIWLRVGKGGRLL